MFSLVSPGSSGPGLSTAEAALIAAGIAAVTSLLTLTLTGLFRWRSASRAERMTAAQAQADWITDQIDKLYGPLYLWILLNRLLAKKLREDKDDADGWHLLDHLEQVVTNPADRALATQIMTINREIERAIFAHPGLLNDGAVPESFIRFLGHYRFVMIAFEAALQNERVPREFSAKEFHYHPSDFDVDVETTYRALQDERSRLRDLTL